MKSRAQVVHVMALNAAVAAEHGAPCSAEVAEVLVSLGWAAIVGEPDAAQVTIEPTDYGRRVQAQWSGHKGAPLQRHGVVTAAAPEPAQTLEGERAWTAAARVSTRPSDADTWGLG